MNFDKERILNLDRNHVWHPFTQMKDYEENDPLTIVRGKGIKLYDADGKEYYDTISSWWTNILGHCNPEIASSIKNQVDTLEHVNFSGITHPYATDLVEKLNSITPEKLCRFFFSDDGSTAVEVAIKMAFQYWQNIGKKDKKRFVMVKNSYHGDTIGAVSVGGVDLYHSMYKPLMFESFQAECPDCSVCEKRKSEFTFDAKDTNCDMSCFNSMESILKEKKDEIAAVIIEPLLLGAGGMKVYPGEYLESLCKTAEENNILVIFDEVATGFGRTGKMFALENTGCSPDIMCISKGLTGGFMPLALTVCTEKIFEGFYDDYSSYKTFFHGHSYTGNPLACSAANATINILKRENLPESNKDTVEHFHNRLKDFKDYDFISDIRYIGFIGAVDIVKSRGKKLDFNSELRLGYKIYLKSLEYGLILRPLGDTIYWFLPLIVNKEDIDQIIDKSIKVIKETVNEFL